MGEFGLDFGSLFGGAMSLGGQIYSTDRAIEAARAQQEREQQFNAEQASLNREWQTSEREAQNQWNLDQWNRNNEYNSLSAQIERALAAGVNPNAVIGNGAGVASSPAQGSSIGSGAQASTPSIAGELMEVISGAPSRFASSINEMANAVGTSIDNKTRHKINEKRAKQIDANIESMLADGVLKKEDADLIRANRGWLDRLNNGQLDKLYTEANAAYAQMQLYYQQSRVADTSVDEIKANTTLIEEQVNTERAKQRVLEQEAIKEKLLNNFREETGLDPNTSLLPAALQIAQRHDRDEVSVDDIIEACMIMCSPQLVQGAVDIISWFKDLFNKSGKPKNFPQPNYVVIQ